MPQFDSTMHLEATARVLRREVGLPDHADVQSPAFVRFIIRLTERLDLEIPRADYPRLATVSGCLTYVRELL